MHAIFLAEFIGTFILVLSILVTGNPLFIAAAFLAAITIASKVSGGHVSPIVSLVMLMNGTIKMSQFLVYVPAQLAGALTAYGAYKLLR